MSKTIRELSQLDGKVYIYLKDVETEQMFLEDAAKEGFTFLNGTDSVNPDAADFYAMNADGSIHFIEETAHPGQEIKREHHGRKVISVDYFQWKKTKTLDL